MLIVGLLVLATTTVTAAPSAGRCRRACARMAKRCPDVEPAPRVCKRLARIVERCVPVHGPCGPGLQGPGTMGRSDAVGSVREPAIEPIRSTRAHEPAVATS
jgi:hypothetical protein